MTRLQSLGLVALAVSTLVGVANGQPPSRLFSNQPSRSLNSFEQARPATQPFGFDSRSQGCRTGDCPLTLTEPTTRSSVRSVRRLDVDTACARLEFAAELLAADLATEPQGMRGAANALDASDRLVEAAQRLRRQARTSAVSLNDLGAAVSAFQQIDRSLNGIRVNAVTERDLELTARLLKDVADSQRSEPSRREPTRPERVRPRNLIDDFRSPNIAPERQPFPAVPSFPPPMPRSLRPSVSIPENMKGIASLPVEDQAAALAQRDCPVTGEPLGSHGTPLKVNVRGQDVFVCCQGCVASLRDNPSRNLRR